MKRKSIKKNLIVRLYSLIALTLSITYFSSFLNTKREIAEVFDADMIKSAKLIFTVIQHDSFVKNSTNLDIALQQKILNRYEYQIHSQAWKNNKIIFNSGENLNLVEPSYEGFLDLEIKGNKWRSFSFFDQNSQIKILVLEQYDIRKELASEIFFSLSIPLFISFIPLFFIIFSVVKNELKSLNSLARKIARISSSNIKSFTNPHVPLELRPFLKSFNALLIKLSDSMESEKRFTDYAAHELNTPLAAIKIQAQLLANNQNPQKATEYLQDLIAGVNRATHLIEQLLTLSRLQVDDKNFLQEKFCVANLTNSILKNYYNKIAEKNLKIEFLKEENEEEFVITANRFYIEILISNLIDNALKYCINCGLIKISISKNLENIIFKISNDGEKISDEEIAKIFHNFYRANKTSHRYEITGSGLGLAIAKKIVDLHSGSISFKSHNAINSVIVSLSKN